MDSLFISQFQQINELLKRARTILVASHENPDADAVGSVLSLNLVFKKMGLEPFLYLSDPSPKIFSFLPGFFEIKNEIPANLKFDLLFGLDYGDFRRLKLPDCILTKQLLAENVITVDHHLGDQKGKVKIVNPKISSTSEIIYWWLKESPPQIINIDSSAQILQSETLVDKEIATCLLTGIVADTGGFSHFSTSSKTLRAASDLLTKGVSLTKIVNRTLSPDPVFALKSAKIFGKVLSRIKIIPEYSLVYSWLSYQDLKNQPNSVSELNGILDGRGLAGIISKESSCNLALFLTEYEKRKVRCSLRSEPFKRKRVDQIAKRLGGGGHPYAAGFSQEGTIEEVLKKVIKLIEPC